MKRWRIRRIVNGCAAQQMVARQGVIAPEFISYGYPCNQQKGLSQAGLTIHSSRRRLAARLNSSVKLTRIKLWREEMESNSENDEKVRKFQEGLRDQPF